jgi:two-component system, cell cycle sensor histidine kinase and response regulator CckA
MQQRDETNGPCVQPDRLEEAFRAVLNGVYSAVMIHDGAGTVLDVNENMLRLYKVEREEILGLDVVADLSAVENPAGELRDLWGKALAGESSQLEWKAMRPHDGSVFDVEVRLSRVPFQGLDAVLAAVRAVGESQESEAERREAHKMEAVGRLAGGIAHDFNNLLTTISGYTDLLLQSVAPDDPRHDDLLEVSQASRKAAVITRQLLALSRSHVLRPRVLDLNDVVAAMAETLHELLGKEIELEFLLDPALQPVAVDPGRMQEVLANLALNARETMLDGGRLIIATANAQEEGEPRVLLVVTDTGPAVGEHVGPHLFEPFLSTGNSPGSGLGLSTVYGIVNQSGGSITLDSEPDRGSIFRISLPASSSSDASVAALDALPLAMPLHGPTILLVDDQEMVRRLTARSLRQSGYEVLEAGDGQEALKLVSQDPKKVRLLLTDISMPGMDGRELARRVTAGRPKIKVVLMSGYSAQIGGDEDEGSLQWGFLEKPFTLEGLLQKVGDALSD